MNHRANQKEFISINKDWYHKKYYLNMIRDYPIPIKMILKHKPTNRTFIIYRQHPFDIIPIITKSKKIDLLLNWLFFPYCELKTLYTSQSILFNKFSINKRLIITTQEIPSKICEKLKICETKSMQITSVDECVRIYSKCKSKSLRN